MAIVAVQFFGLSRGLFRYGERLVGHDAAFRLPGRPPGAGVRAAGAAGAGGPARVPAGDLLARIVRDVDSLQDLVIRVIPPFGTAVVVGAVTVALMWWMLPAPPSSWPWPWCWRPPVVPCADRVAGPAPGVAVTPQCAGTWVRP